MACRGGSSPTCTGRLFTVVPPSRHPWATRRPLRQSVPFTMSMSMIFTPTHRTRPLLAVADPFRRDAEHNLTVQKSVEAAGGADVVLSASVLNVVSDLKDRMRHLLVCARAMKVRRRCRAPASLPLPAPRFPPHLSSTPSDKHHALVNCNIRGYRTPFPPMALGDADVKPGARLYIFVWAGS